MLARDELIQRRKSLRMERYLTLNDVGLDGNYISPPQISSCSLTGPVLLAYNWLDAPSARRHREILKRLGYLPGMPFNKVVDGALALVGLSRTDIYITQAFHMLPASRSDRVTTGPIDYCMREVGKYELAGRRIIAMGGAASQACRRHGVEVHHTIPHPSARGITDAEKIDLLASVLL